MKGGDNLYNVILFWLLVFGIIYVFTREEREEEIEEKVDEENGILELPCKRDEIAKLLKDGLREDEKKLEMKRFKNKCFNCGSEEELCFDHHLPLSKGYPLKSREVGSNVVVLCRKCNEKKGSKLPQEFYTTDKLKKLEEMGVKSHLYYSSERIERIDESLISGKLELLKIAIEDERKISFIYLDRGKILFLEEEIEEVPVRVYSKIRIRRYNYTLSRDWYMEGKSGRYYNISWIHRLGEVKDKKL